MRNILMILLITLGRLRNEVHAEFMHNIRRVIEKFGIHLLDIANQLYAHFTTAYQNELEALDFIRGSEITAQIAEQDRVRDSVYKGFIDSVKAARNHFDAAKRVAANKLWYILNKYGNVAKKTFDAETAAIADILREFQKEEYRDAIDTLQLQDWYIQLEQENNRFRDLLSDRFTEVSEKTGYRMETARMETDKYYRALLMFFESKYLANPDDDEFNAFLNELNPVIKRYKDILAQEFGRRNAGKEPAPNTTPQTKIVSVEKLEDGKFQITKEG